MNSLSFNIDRFIFTTKSQELDLSFIPANTRRRLNSFDKHVLYMLNHCIEETVENIVLSSQYGEFERLISLIEQYNEFNEVSPMIFSASVHNYPLGQFSLLKQKTFPTISVSAGTDSFISGLITAITEPQKNVVYCYADNTEQENFGICFNIKNNNPKNYILRNTNLKHTEFSLKETINLFNGKTNSIQIQNFNIERVLS